mmetsp:Transcript_46789/g.61895  ORF Transcript_46789/g.61895 Transcript_46789/m.61895 type:complete len:360 (+) Transcript_46789:884-1963(+)
MKLPVDLQAICDDLKVCGRREMGILIRLRHKYQAVLEKKAKEVADAEKAEREAAKEPEDEDAKIDRELEETMKRIAKEKKRQAKKEKVQADKSELRKKMSVIATTVLDNDEDLTLSRKLWDEVAKKGFEGVGEKSDDDESESSEESKGSDDSDMEEDEADGDSSVEEIDEKEARVAEMADQMESQIKNTRDYQMTVDRNMAGKEAKKRALIEQQRLRLEDLAEKEALDNAGLLDSADDSDLDSEDRMYKLAAKEDRKTEMIEGRDNESSGESDPEGDQAKGLFVNPLAKKNAAAKDNESEEWSDVDEDDKDGKKNKNGKKKDTILGKRKRRNSIDDVQDFFKNDTIEEVPANDPGTLAQ